MAWIESHQALERHPKVRHLSRLMAWDLDGTIGKLHRFWWWCLDYAPTGDLRLVDPLSIPQGLDLEGLDADKFLSAMMQSHWICPLKGGKSPFRVHDWVNYSGGYLRDSKFRRHPEKWAQVIELYKLPCQPTVSRQSVNRSPTVSGLSAVPNQPDLTLPNQPNLTNRSIASLTLEAVVREWNLHQGIIQARSVTGPIRKAVERRIAEHTDIDWWRSLFQRVAASDFLAGRKTDFAASLDWVLGPKNLAKIENGNYDNRVSANGYDALKEAFLNT